MIILAHRGNISGPQSARKENAPEAVQAAIEEGFGVEIDIRLDGKQLYVSHELSSPRSREIERYTHLLRRASAQGIALNIKQSAVVGKLERYVRLLGLREAFLFDFELIGVVPVSGGLHAVRVSDLKEEDYRKRRDLSQWPYIWIDEMRQSWVNRRIVQDLRRKTPGKLVWVSPELHGRPYRARWCEAVTWPIDGICTDYPRAFARMQKP